MKLRIGTKAWLLGAGIAVGLASVSGCSSEPPEDSNAKDKQNVIESADDTITAAGDDTVPADGLTVIEPADDSATAAGNEADSAVAGASVCKCLGQPLPTCTPTGHITYTLKRAANPTVEQQSAYNAISCAMDGALAYYNCNTSLSGNIPVSYSPGVPTAQASYGGSIAFGKGKQYMVCATAMHEVAHRYGIGIHPKWKSHVGPGSLWVGPAANTVMQFITKNPKAVIHVAGVHFWPYGLNYASEAKSPTDLINHTKVVIGLRDDLATSSKVNLALGAPVSASSSHESTTSSWGRALATDGQRTGTGWSSEGSRDKNHTEWVQVDLRTPQPLREVMLFPRSDDNGTGYGFPVDFTIGVSTDGRSWTTVVTVSGQSLPDTGEPQIYTFAETSGRYVRITGTKLLPIPVDKHQYRMQLAEIEVYATGK